ncbi:Pyruvate dehydrogenase E1 component [compost metagenome]
MQRQREFSGDLDARSHVQQCLPGTTPVVAVSDYVRGYVQLIAPYLQAPLSTLGTDGFGRSDTRSALRRFFELDRHHIVVSALAMVDASAHAKARAQYRIDANNDAPWNC